MQKKLAKRYAELFSLFHKHADTISRVTFWGVHDGVSWRHNWPVRGRTDYPLLFDSNCKPKPAFNAVSKVVQGGK
jgi:endo-1,4-beta-xylanase